MYALNNLENKEKFKLFSSKHYSLKIFKPTEDRYAGQGSSQLLTLSHKMYSASRRSESRKQPVIQFTLHISRKHISYLRAAKCFLTWDWERKSSCIHLQRNTTWDHTPQPHSNCIAEFCKLPCVAALTVSRGCLVWRDSVGGKTLEPTYLGWNPGSITY